MTRKTPKLALTSPGFHATPKLTPFLGRPGQCGYFYATPKGGRLTTTYDLACSRPHARRIFGEIGFRAYYSGLLSHRGPKINGKKIQKEHCLNMWIKTN
ncbi:hypothetical protein AVEN_130593-1 [Araneus ventricosus]|uniref:Uncharacterized protein n=1 Tax=Araneus ventricosus TaxID=182803 RepID=A0A4Y2TYY1_ARAVE|nr:hypothetical protein AVEN_130593-1 [Araneus ventricosus]